MKTKLKDLVFISLLLSLFLGCNSNDKSDAYGNFEATEVIISSESTGKILQFQVEEGQLLKHGQKVGVVDTLSLHLNYLQLKAQRQAQASQLTSVRSEIAVLNEQKRIAEKEVKRFENLVKENAVAQKQLDDFVDQVQVLEKRIQATRSKNAGIQGQVRALDAQIMQIEDQLRKSTIYNPISGVVLAKYAEENEITAYGKPLYKIANLDTLFLRAYVSGAQLPNVKIGQKVSVAVDKNESENQTLNGQITWISDKAEFTPKIIQTKEERVVMVYAVKVRVNNKEGLLKIGMPGELNFQ